MNISAYFCKKKHRRDTQDSEMVTYRGGGNGVEARVGIL